MNSPITVEELSFSFNTSKKTVTILNFDGREEILTMSESQAIWLAERILKNVDWEIKKPEPWIG